MDKMGFRTKKFPKKLQKLFFRRSARPSLRTGGAGTDGKKSGRRELIFLLLLCCLLPSLWPGLPLGAEDSSRAAGGPTVPYGGFEKIETVYADTDHAGAPTGIIVSEWLKNLEGREYLLDISSLAKIKSLKDGQSLNSGEDGLLIWKVEEGKDIYYQGQSQGKLPVGVDITYELEGRPVAAAELAGQSGHVRIRYQYTNELFTVRSINRQKTAIYNPFTLFTMIQLPEGVFSNVQVEKGRYLDLGGGGTVVGYGCPGLRETLGAGDDLFDVPDWFAFSADAENFRLDAVTTVALPEFVLSDMLDSLDQIDDLLADLRDLSDGSRELTQGCDDFTDGVSELADGLQQYVDGVGELGQGLEELAGRLPRLNEGIAELLDASSRLADGAGQMAGALSASGRQLPEMSDGIQEMLDGIYDLCLNLNSAAADIRASLPQDEELSQLEAGLGPALQLQGQRAAAAEPQQAPLEGLIYTVLQQYQASVLPMLRHTLPGLAAGLETMSRGLSEIWDGLKELKDGTGELQEGFDQLEEGLWQLESGQQAVSDGLNQLGEGADELRDGLEKLHSGSAELADSGEELKDGADFLREGARDLSDGLAELHNDGILELQRQFNEHFAGMAQRRDAMLEIGETYQSFTELPPEVKGQVKFVFRTPEISVKKALPLSGQEPGRAKEPSFFQRTGLWFKGLWSRITGLFR